MREGKNPPSKLVELDWKFKTEIFFNFSPVKKFKEPIFEDSFQWMPCVDDKYQFNYLLKPNRSVCLFNSLIQFYL